LTYFMGTKSVRPGRRGVRPDAGIIGRAPAGIHWAPGGPICPTEGRVLLAAVKSVNI
jgi:hypothetical protein